MRILLDANIYFGDWHLRSADFAYLFHFLNNEGGELLLPRIVLEEAMNNQSRELDAILEDVGKQLAVAGSSMVNRD